MKKRVMIISIITIIAVALILALALFNKAKGSETTEEISDEKIAEFAESWGEYLSNESTPEFMSPQSNDPAYQNDDQIYAEGKDVVITHREIEQAMKYYELSGMNINDPEEKAYEYMKESKALYAKAISEGYDVTDEEVDEYVDSLRTLFDDEGIDPISKLEYEKIIEGFGDEEQYWEYEKRIYHTLLPSTNYVTDLQKNYYNGASKESDEWDTYFAEFKQQLVKEQHFKKPR